MKAKSELDANIPQELPEYESYDIEMHNLPVFPFHESKKYDILNPIFLSTKGLEHMAYFKVNWNNYTEELSKKANTENWSNQTYPNNGILTNYIAKTYDKLTIYNVIDYCSQTQAVYDHLWNCSYPINELLHSFLDLFTGVKKYVVYY